MTIESSKPCVAQQLEDVVHARLADDRHHRLRLVRGQRAQARSLASGHHDGFHVFTSRLAFRRTKRGEREAEADPEDDSAARACPGAVTIVRAERRVQQPRRRLAEHVHLEAVAALERERRCIPEEQDIRGGIEKREPTGAGPHARAGSRPMSISSRSASGSAILPKLDSTRQRRAR